MRHTLDTICVLGDICRELARQFDYTHLPPDLQVVSRPFHEMMVHLSRMPHSWSKTIALQSLLQAKDAAVRAAIYERENRDNG